MKPQEEHNEAEKGKRNMEKLFDLQVFAQENTQTTGGLSARDENLLRHGAAG